MMTLLYSKSATITCTILVFALVVATCHAAGPNGHDHQITDSIPSLQRTNAKINRKLLAVKAPRAWTTLWTDEFDAWDSNKWGYNLQDGCQYSLCGWGNGELEYYTSNSSNVRVSNGNLIIEAKEVTGAEQAAVQQDCWDECGRRCVSQGYTDGTPELQSCVQSCGQGRCPNIRFTSARIHTSNKFSVSPSAQYPTIRVEARIQLPPGTGLWPAFWMLPQVDKYGPWPGSGEIDVMESFTTMKNAYGAIHYGGPGAHKSTSLSTPITPGYHVFRTDWSEKEIRWYVDDISYGSVVNRGRQGWYSAGAQGSSTAPFGAGDNFFLLLNLAVGGAYPGYPSADSISQSMATGPKQMFVDYVRVMGQ